MAVYKGSNENVGDLSCWEPNPFRFIHADARKISKYNIKVTLHLYLIDMKSCQINS